jgi:hypothetical protein
MVVHLAARIKMGEEGICDARAACPSSRQAEQHEERAIEVVRGFRIDAADHPPNAVTTERDQFVGHDLRTKAKTVLWGNLDYRPERKSVLQVRRNGANEDCRKAGVEIVTLNDDARPRPPEIARDDHQHDIAARYFHESQS